VRRRGAGRVAGVGEGLVAVPVGEIPKNRGKTISCILLGAQLLPILVRIESGWLDSHAKRRRNPR